MICYVIHQKLHSHLLLAYAISCTCSVICASDELRLYTYETEPFQININDISHSLTTTNTYTQREREKTNNNEKKTADSWVISVLVLAQTLLFFIIYMLEFYLKWKWFNSSRLISNKIISESFGSWFGELLIAATSQMHFEWVILADCNIHFAKQKH